MIIDKMKFKQNVSQDPFKLAVQKRAEKKEALKSQIYQQNLDKYNVLLKKKTKEIEKELSNVTNIDDFMKIYNKLPDEIKQNLTIDPNSLKLEQSKIIKEIDRMYSSSRRIKRGGVSRFLRNSQLNGREEFLQKVKRIIKENNIGKIDWNKFNIAMDYYSKIRGLGMAKWLAKRYKYSTGKEAKKFYERYSRKQGEYKKFIDNFLKELTAKHDVKLDVKDIEKAKLKIKKQKNNKLYDKINTYFGVNVPPIDRFSLDVEMRKHKREVKKAEEQFEKNVKTYARQVENIIKQAKIYNIDELTNFLDRLDPRIRKEIKITKSSLLNKRKDLINKLEIAKDNYQENYAKERRYEKERKYKAKRDAAIELLNKLKSNSNLVFDYSDAMTYINQKGSYAYNLAKNKLKAKAKRDKVLKQIKDIQDTILKSNVKKITFTKEGVSKIVTKDGKTYDLSKYSKDFKTNISNLYDKKLNHDLYAKKLQKYESLKSDFLKSPTKTKQNQLNSLADELNKLALKL